MDALTEDQISLVLCAVAHIIGAWNREMRIPPPQRPLLVAHEGPNWKLNAQEFPVPSAELLAEIRRIERHLAGQTAASPPAAPG